jgi:hypothetical protein
MKDKDVANFAISLFCCSDALNCTLTSESTKNFGSGWITHYAASGPI